VTEAPIHEADLIHTRALQVSLAVEESAAFWAHHDPARTRTDEAIIAFEERWFGHRSLARVRVLLGAFEERFVAFGPAQAALARWLPRDASTRGPICHWHVQLADPLYRAFASTFLDSQRERPERAVTHDHVERWLEQGWSARWGPSTRARMASGLLSTAAAAGLCGDPEGPLNARPLRWPAVSDDALTWLLYLLRAVGFTGTLRANPYLASVGLTGELLEQRLRGLTALRYGRMMDVTEFGWLHPDLNAWVDSRNGDLR